LLGHLPAFSGYAGSNHHTRVQARLKPQKDFIGNGIADSS